MAALRRWWCPSHTVLTLIAALAVAAWASRSSRCLSVDAIGMMALRRWTLVAVCALVAAAAIGASAQEMEAPQDLAMMEVGAQSTISAHADRPMQDVAELLVAANRDMQRLATSRNTFNVVANHVKIRRDTNVRLGRAIPPPVEHVNAQLIASLQQPTIHDPQRFGTKHPIRQGRKYVSAEIVGEDGKPFAPRKQWKGINVEAEPEIFRSPFAKYIHPPAVGSSADVVNKDPNTKLTPIEKAAVSSIQLRLKSLLERLGANIVWDHTLVANRKLISEYDALKIESRTLMEEYELRTGVKTIAWQLQENDIKGLTVPLGRTNDIHFASQPDLASRRLQRPGDRKAPPVPSQKELRALRKEHGIASPPPFKPQEQVVNVAWKKQADGLVKAKVNLKVVDSKVPRQDQPANLAARVPVAGKLFKSGRRGSPSKAVQIDVVAPANEQLKRNLRVGAPTKAKKVKEVKVDDAPKINL